jgi:eukaryotic-like serine/threonine-protein kinase
VSNAPAFQTAIGDLYHVLRELGGGGMSRVYLAEEASLGRRVAIKVLPAEWGAGVSAERFQREIYLAASLSHPHIVPLLTAGESADGQLYYTMPFVDGESLRERLAREGELPIGDALRVLRNVADALTYAHARGVVHCDIKPGNILLAGQHALVTDFGIARALSEAGGPDGGSLVGTPAYMAPEQVTPGAIVDHRADVYAMGAVAYEMLTGRPPYAGVSPLVVLASHVTESPDPLTGVRSTIPAALAQLVHDCLEKRPADRPQTAEQVLRAIEGLAVRQSGETSAGWVQGQSAAERASGGYAEPPHVMQPRQADRRRGRRTAGVVSGIAVIAFGTVMAANGGDTMLASLASTLRSPFGPRAPVAGAPATIAVLPFVNLSPSREAEYFSDGVTEEITNALAQVDGLKVASRTSAFAFKGREVDVREIGRQLGVATVLEGSVRRDGERVRITAQLVNTADGYHVWSRSYERGERDVFEMQDDIARAIAGRLAGLVEDRDSPPLVRPATGDVDAYDLYLRGRYSWNERTESGIRKAIAFLQDATRRDSLYALAYAGLADAYVILPDYSDVPTSDAYARAKAAARKALQIDSTVSSAHASLAVVQTYNDWDWAGADRSFRRAIALKPSYATAHQWYANYLMTVGKLDSALAEDRRARDLDPSSRVINTQIGQALYLGRRYPEAEAALRKAVAVDPTFTYARNVLAQVLLQQKRYPEARKEVEQCLAIDGRQSLHLMALGYLDAMEGKRAEALQVIDELKDRATHQYVAPSIIATIYAALGDRDAGFQWLGRALEDRESSITYLQYDPVFDSLRKDARYEAMLRSMKLR